MSWSSRQQKLRNMFGKQEDLCFQVVVCYYPDESNERYDFEKACEKHNIEYELNTPMCENFEITYEGLDFGNGFVIINNDGSVETFDPCVEVIYTMTDTKKINEMLKGDDSEDENIFFDHIVSVYLYQIEKELKCKFKMGAKYMDWGRGAFKFQFIIHPYTPQLCHPRDVGVLKPITLVDGYVIDPEQAKFSTTRQLSCE